MDRDERLKRLWGANNLHLRVILEFYNNRGYIDNMRGLSTRLGVAHVTLKKVVNDLIELGFLEVLFTGKSKIVRLDERNRITQEVINFIKSVESLSER